VAKVRPSRYVVFDGAKLWTGGDVFGESMSDSLVAWRMFSPSSMFWGAFLTPRLETAITLENDDSDWPVLTSRTFSHQMRAATQPDTQPQQVVRMKFMGRASLMPYSLVKTIIRNGDMDMTQFGGTPAYHGQGELLIPNHWRTLHQLATDGNSLVPYDTLVPADEGKGVPAAWYGDPAKTWP
jgi:hypothetical protein